MMMMIILIVVRHDAVKDEKFCSLTLYVFCFVMLIIIYVLLAGSLIYYIWSFIQVMEWQGHRNKGPEKLPFCHTFTHRKIELS